MNVYDLLFVHGADVQSTNMEILKLNINSYFCFAAGWVSEEPWLTPFLSIQVLCVCTVAGWGNCCVHLKIFCATLPLLHRGIALC